MQICPNTGITIPECSCSACLEAQLRRYRPGPAELAAPVSRSRKAPALAAKGRLSTEQGAARRAAAAGIECARGGPALDRAQRRGRRRHPAASGEAKRPLDRAAPGARRRLRRPSRATGASAAWSSPEPAPRSAPGWTRASSAATSSIADSWSRRARWRSRRWATAGGRSSPPSTAPRSRADSRCRCCAICESHRPRPCSDIPELPRGIPPSYAAARAVLPATIAQELCLTGRLVKADEAQKLGIVREVSQRRGRPRARARTAGRPAPAQGGPRDQAKDTPGAPAPLGLPVRGRAASVPARAARARTPSPRRTARPRRRTPASRRSARRPGAGRATRMSPRAPRRRESGRPA